MSTWIVVDWDARPIGGPMGIATVDAPNQETALQMAKAKWGGEVREVAPSPPWKAVFGPDPHGVDGPGVWMLRHSSWESKMSIEELVKRIEQGEDPKAVVEGYMVPSFSVGNRVLVQGLPSPLSGKVIALKEDGDLCTIETEKGTMDVPARHLVMQEGLKHEQQFTSGSIADFLYQHGFTFNGTRGHLDEWTGYPSGSDRVVIEVGPIWGEEGPETMDEGWQIHAKSWSSEGGLGVAALRDEFERLGWI